MIKSYGYFEEGLPRSWHGYDAKTSARKQAELGFWRDCQV